MRAAIATTTLVLVALVWFSWDRLAPELIGETGSGEALSRDVGAGPPAESGTTVETQSPPPVPEMPDGRYATAAEVGEATEPRIHVVREGETLWSIAVEHFGDGHRARAIYEANRDQIGDPANLREGQELVLP